MSRAAADPRMDPEFLAEIPHRLWPRQRVRWAMALRAEVATRAAAADAFAQRMRATEAAELERLWRRLMADDAELPWLRRDLLADLYAQLGHEL